MIFRIWFANINLVIKPFRLKNYKNYGTNSQKKFHLKKGVFINKSINK